MSRGFESSHFVSQRMDRSDALSWRPLRLLTLYRLILAGLLFTLFFMLPENRTLGSDNPLLYASVSLGYLAFALIAGFATRKRKPGFQIQVFTQTVVDILAIILLMHASGGLGSGLGILLVLAVIPGALLMPGRMAFFFAALATVGLFIEFGYRFLENEVFSGNITQSGVLGSTLFIVASIAHFLGKRIQESEALAEQRGVDLANLARLNEYVVQRLKNGLIVVDAHNRIRLLNDTAWTMLQLPPEASTEHLGQISEELTRQLRFWRDNPEFEGDKFTPNRSQSELQPRFQQLGNIRGAATLIWLEDTAQLAQQAQQMKLAAVGRLSANIAHEIRNPLGAISHAGQLLNESARLDSNDRHLLDIIQRHAVRVNDIIENVLHLSRRGAAHPQPILLADWLNEFMDDGIDGGRIEEGTMSVDVEPDELTVSFDTGHLHQLIWNLVQNAYEHNQSADNFRIQLIGRINETGTPYLDIIDNGSGIDPETAQQIFEPFFTTSTQGTGLGLYLAKELAESNGARLDMIKTSEQGSCFRISFRKSL